RRIAPVDRKTVNTRVRRELAGLAEIAQAVTPTHVYPGADATAGFRPRQTARHHGHTDGYLVSSAPLPDGRRRCTDRGTTRGRTGQKLICSLVAGCVEDVVTDDGVVISVAVDPLDGLPGVNGDAERCEAVCLRHDNLDWRTRGRREAWRRECGHPEPG